MTDILQMMGRAGRPQFDKEGVAVIMCEESKKTFLKKVSHQNSLTLTHSLVNSLTLITLAHLVLI